MIINFCLNEKQKNYIGDYSIPARSLYFYKKLNGQ